MVLVIWNILEPFCPALYVCTDVFMCVLHIHVALHYHFSQRDSADSWLKVVPQIWNYFEFILEEVYKT